MKKLLGIVVLGLLLGVLTSCSDSPYEDCYKKNYKELRDEKYSKADAARIAKRKCD